VEHSEPQPGHSHCHYHGIRCITLGMFTSTADPALDQMIDRALAATMSLRWNAWWARCTATSMTMHNITIGEIHTNYATNQKIAQWDLGRNCTTTIRAISFGDSLHSGRT